MLSRQPSAGIWPCRMKTHLALLHDRQDCRRCARTYRRQPQCTPAPMWLREADGVNVAATHPGHRSGSGTRIAKRVRALQASWHSDAPLSPCHAGNVGFDARTTPIVRRRSARACVLRSEAALPWLGRYGVAEGQYRRHARGSVASAPAPEGLQTFRDYGRCRGRRVPVGTIG